MGEVYRARDTRLGREVALKRLSDEALAGEVVRRRVLREARAAGALSHPGIATIYDVLDTPEGLFIVMEFVPGQTLAAKLRSGALPLDDALEIGEQLAAALAHAHERGVVHRDLKPANVHLTPQGHAKILDFGIAKSEADGGEAETQADELATAVGRIVGSPGYMSPEQLTGQPSDARTDVHAAGLLLFEMLTGSRPYARPDRLSSALATLEGPLPRADERSPLVPRDVADVVARAMARLPGDRFSSAAALGAAIEGSRRSLSNTETLDTIRPVPRPRANRAAIVVLIVAVLVATALPWVRKHFFESPVPAHSTVLGVIPFRNLGDAADDPLVAGLNDALMKRLGSVRSLRVLPVEEIREALASAKSNPAAISPAAIARTTGADLVVEGSLQRAGSTIAVDAAVVGRDGQRRPIARYSGEATQVFQLHRRLAEAVTAALAQEGALGDNVSPEPAPPTANQDAFAEYAQARVFLDRPDIPGNLDHAITLLQKAISRDSRFALAHAALGEAYWAQFRETRDAAWTMRAQAANLDALAIDPAQPEVRMALAVMYEGSGRIDQAVEELRKVMAQQPRNDSAHLVLSRILAGQGKWDDAAVEAKVAIDLRPAYWKNREQLGDTLLHAGRLEDAAAAYSRQIDLQPDSARGYQRLGTALQSLGRRDEALQTYRQAAAIRPTPATYSNIGTLYYWRGDYAEAANAYQRAIQLSPNNPKTYGNLADAQTKLGRKQQALANYRRAVEEAKKLLAVNPKDTDILASLALCQAKLGDRAAALDTVQKAIGLNAEDGDLLFVRAQIRALAADNEGACEGLREAMAHGKNAEEIRHADELKGLKGCAAYDGLAPGK